VGNGTTIDAIRSELQTGNPTGGTFHSIKGQESINGLQKLLNKGGLSSEDEAIAYELIDVLLFEFLELRQLLGSEKTFEVHLKESSFPP